MLAFDIFRMDQEGNLSWVEMAPTQKGAREQVQWYVTRSPAVYFILSQPDGELEIIEPGDPKPVPHAIVSTVWTNN
jgi:hypothetical protein